MTVYKVVNEDGTQISQELANQVGRRNHLFANAVHGRELNSPTAWNCEVPEDEGPV